MDGLYTDRGTPLNLIGGIASGMTLGVLTGAYSAAHKVAPLPFAPKFSWGLFTGPASRHMFFFSALFSGFIAGETIAVKLIGIEPGYKSLACGCAGFAAAGGGLSRSKTVMSCLFFGSLLFAFSGQGGNWRLGMSDEKMALKMSNDPVYWEMMRNSKSKVKE